MWNIGTIAPPRMDTHIVMKNALGHARVITTGGGDRIGSATLGDSWDYCSPVRCTEGNERHYTYKGAECKGKCEDTYQGCFYCYKLMWTKLWAKLGLLFLLS